MIQDLWFSVWGLGFRVQASTRLGLRIQSLGFMIEDLPLSAARLWTQRYFRA
jgi:hypothetical protein